MAKKRSHSDAEQGSGAAPAADVAAGDDAAPVNKNKRYRKDKPWDTDDVDHWEIPKFTQDDNPSGLTEESR